MRQRQIQLDGLNDSANDDKVHFKWTFVPTAKAIMKGRSAINHVVIVKKKDKKKSIIGRAQVFGRRGLTLLLLRLFQNYNCNID